VGVAAIAAGAQPALGEIMPDGSLRAPPRHRRDAPVFRVLHLDK
jgi:hypothetical protein